MPSTGGGLAPKGSLEQKLWRPLKIADEPLHGRRPTSGRTCAVQRELHPGQKKQGRLGGRGRRLAGRLANKEAPSSTRSAVLVSGSWGAAAALSYTKLQLRDVDYGNKVKSGPLAKSHKCGAYSPQGARVGAEARVVRHPEAQAVRGKTAQREVGAWHANDNGIWMAPREHGDVREEQGGLEVRQGLPIPGRQPVAQSPSSRSRSARPRARAWSRHWESGGSQKQEWLGQDGRKPVAWSHRGPSARRQNDAIGGFQLRAAGYTDLRRRCHVQREPGLAAINKGAWSRRRRTARSTGPRPSRPSGSNLRAADPTRRSATAPRVKPRAQMAEAASPRRR